MRDGYYYLFFFFVYHELEQNVIMRILLFLCGAHNNGRQISI